MSFCFIHVVLYLQELSVGPLRIKEIIMSNYDHLPRFDDMFIVILRHLSNTEPMPWRALEKPVAEAFHLNDEDLTIEYQTGNGTVFLDRLSWSISYLVNSGLAERPKRGHCQITDLGRRYLSDEEGLKNFVKQTIAARSRRRSEDTTAAESSAEQLMITGTSTTPQEQLLSAYESIRAAECEQILDTILTKNPYEFEKLVVRLLGRMGYGGKTADSLLVTKASGDGGIDGIIKEDVLGLGRINLQAKRYKRDSGIGREEIQKFVGALAVAQSQKGVFITTSYFTRGAIEYVQSLNGSTTIVLIDGEQLSQYIYEFGLGMQEVQTLTLKKRDSDFWDNMLDDA